jgi:hypothetical protein
MHSCQSHQTKPTMTQNATDAAAVSPVALSARPLSARSVGAMLLLAIMWGLSIPFTKLGFEQSRRSR